MGVVRRAKDGHYYEYRRTYGGRFYTVQHGHQPPSSLGPVYVVALTLGLFIAPLFLASIPHAFQAEIEFRQREAAELQRPNLVSPQ